MTSAFDPLGAAAERTYFSSSVNTTMSRTVTKAVLSVEQDEGVGARVRRSIGRKEVSGDEGVGRWSSTKRSVG